MTTLATDDAYDVARAPLSALEGLFDLFDAGTVTPQETALVLPIIWGEIGLPTVHAHPDDWLELSDFARPHLPRPTRPAVLYRVASPRFERGMAWSASRAKAEWYKPKRGRYAATYKAIVDPEWIICDMERALAKVRFKSNVREFVVDPRGDWELKEV